MFADAATAEAGREREARAVASPRAGKQWCSYTDPSLSYVFYRTRNEGSVEHSPSGGFLRGEKSIVKQYSFSTAF